MNFYALEAPLELHLSMDQVLQLMLPVYGLSQRDSLTPASGDYWAFTLRRHHHDELGMKHLPWATGTGSGDRRT